MTKFLAVAALILFIGVNGQAEKVKPEAYVRAWNDRIADTAKKFCGILVRPATEPSMPNVDWIFYQKGSNFQGNREEVTKGYLGFSSTGAGTPFSYSPTWSYLNLSGSSFSTISYNQSSSIIGAPGSAGNWISFSTPQGGQLAFAWETFTVSHFHQVSRWDGRCGGAPTATWEQFNDCVQQSFANYTARVLCSGK